MVSSDLKVKKPDFLFLDSVTKLINFRKISAQILIQKYPKYFSWRLGYLEKQLFFSVKTSVATFWATFGEI